MWTPGAEGLPARPRRNGWLVILVACSAACTTTRTVSPASPAPSSTDWVSIEAQAVRRSAVVETHAGVRFRADRISLDATGLAAELSDGSARLLPWDEVASIEFRHRGRGALEGAAFGLIPAVGVGVVAAMQPGRLFTSGGAFLIGTVVAGVLTVPIGVVVGLLSGHRLRFELVPR